MKHVTGCNYGIIGGVLGVIYHSDSSLALKFSMTWIDLIGMKSKFVSYKVVPLHFVTGEKRVMTDSKSAD